MGGRRAVRRFPVPTFLQEFPDRVRNLVRGSLRKFPALYLFQYVNSFRELEIWHVPCQDLGD